MGEIPLWPAGEVRGQRWARASSTLSSLLEMTWPRSKSERGDSSWGRIRSISTRARHERTRSWKEASAAVGETDELVDERSRAWPRRVNHHRITFCRRRRCCCCCDHEWRHPNLAAPVLILTRPQRLVFGGYGFRPLSFFLVSQHSPLCLPDCSSSALETSLTH